MKKGKIKSKIKNMPRFKNHLKKMRENSNFEKEYLLYKNEFKIISQLIEKRLSKNISQKDLADKLKTKQSAISRFESGQHSPSLDLIYKIADSLGVKIKIEVE